MQKQEASPSPIRTRREIVPGDYGMVKVGWTDGKDIFISINEGEKQKPLNAEELREAAHLFNQIAEVLEENAR